MLTAYTKTGLIYINPPVKTKSELFRYLADDFKTKGHIKNKKQFIKSLVEREKLGNTELVPHIAIPHSHSSTSQKLFLAVIISKDGIDYDNPRLGHVNLAFLIISDSPNKKNYLQILASAARLIKQKEFFNKIIASTSPREVIDLINHFDPYSIDLHYTGNKLLQIVLPKEEKLSDLISALLEVGITNASIVSSTSLAKKLAYEIPVFAGLKLKSKAEKTNTILVFTTITDDQIPRKLASILKDTGLDLEKKGNGYMQTFKIRKLLGHPDEFI